MRLFDKTKETVSKVKDVASDLVGDETLANMIIAASTKLDSVNEALKAKGSGYRIHGVDIEMGIPPKVIYAVRREFEKK